ncbi:phosphatase domain-containing protein [Mycolicibacterium sp. XJ879]
MPDDDIPPPANAAPGPRGDSLGVVYDVDGVLRIAHPLRLLRRFEALLARRPGDRRSLLGMPDLLRSLAEAAPGNPVFYLTAVPSRFARPVLRFLQRDGYPAGSALMSEHEFAPAGQGGKRAVLARLAEQHPDLRWVLVGDDGGHDPKLFTDFVQRHPGRVAAIALRQTMNRPQPVFDATIVAAPNGQEMLPQLRKILGLGQSREPAVDDWFLTGSERGNPAAQVRAWTADNSARPLVHGQPYFSVLTDALASTAEGDPVLFTGWRADREQLLGDHGPTAAEALGGAARRGALVRGLLWRSHMNLFGYHFEQNRTFAADVGRAGAEVLLDQRIRALGSHHQKCVVIRHPGCPRDDVAFVGGIDLSRGSRDDIEHQGDPQSVSSDEEYGETPARHDIQLELRGPVVRDLEDAFRERWEDPARLARLPWHVVPDRIRGLPRTASPLPAPTPYPPAAGHCAVQILRTYPRRRPPYPFAPLGERSVARAYAKALSRAQRLVYLEDQYLWSVDIARIFAAALRRAPGLRLIAVVPRRIDQKVARRAAKFGQSEAIAMVRAAGGDRVQIFDIENCQGRPVYVHAKVCIIDDVWAAVGSSNLNNRSWTHDSELTAAVLDDDRDLRPPTDPAELGDGARRFARQLRLDLMREHLDIEPGADTDLLEPDAAVAIARRRAAALDAWYTGGCDGSRPPGRFRAHAPDREQEPPGSLRRWFTVPGYRFVLDPDGRPLGMRLRRSY